MSLDYFAVEISKALGWPLAAIAIAYLMRDQLSILVRLLRTAKVGDVELKFGKELAEATEQAANLPAAVAQSPQGGLGAAGAEPNRTPSALPDALALSEIAPSAAILQAWLEVEHAAGETVAQASASSRFVSPGQMRRMLQQIELDQESLGLFDSLRTLRNQVAHTRGLTISPGEAAEFVVLSRRLVAQLKRVSELRRGAAPEV